MSNKKTLIDLHREMISAIGTAIIISASRTYHAALNEHCEYWQRQWDRPDSVATPSVQWLESSDFGFTVEPKPRSSTRLTIGE